MNSVSDIIELIRLHEADPENKNYALVKIKRLLAVAAKSETGVSKLEARIHKLQAKETLEKAEDVIKWKKKNAASLKWNVPEIRGLLKEAKELGADITDCERQLPELKKLVLFETIRSKLALKSRYPGIIGLHPLAEIAADIEAARDRLSVGELERLESELSALKTKMAMPDKKAPKRKTRKARS